MKNNLIYFLFMLVFGLSLTQAQIVNLGKAYLGKGTVYAALSAFDNKNGGSFYNDGIAYFYNNFNNDGNFDYYGYTGHSYFVGQNKQLLSGTATSYFYEISFNNNSQPAPFGLSGSFDVENKAHFVQGVVNNRTYKGKFTFGHKAIQLNTSNYSYVNGPVEKVGERPFIFPVGQDGFYRPAGIGSSVINAFFRVTYFHQNSNFIHPHSHKEADIKRIDNREYWFIKNSGDLDNNQLITLSWNPGTTPTEYIEAAQNQALAIVYWNPEKNIWEDQQGTVDLDHQTITTATNYDGIFTLGQVTTIENNCDIEVYNLLDINGNTQNKFLRIESDKACAEIRKVSVFDRWGVKVFETFHYGREADIFDGYSAGRLSIKRNKPLPTGTYFYIINYHNRETSNSKTRQKVGYLYIKGK